MDGEGQINPYIGSLLDAYNHASKEPMYELFRPNHDGSINVEFLGGNNHKFNLVVHERLV